MHSESKPAFEVDPMDRYGPRTRRLVGLSSFLAGAPENPIFVKHTRTRLRRAQFLPAAAVVAVLCLCIGYGGYELGGFANGGVFAVVLTLQGILLAIIGATQISTSVGAARESGIIDFHRVSPMSPLSLSLGFFFGAPVREYILYALTLPLALICVVNESPSFLSFLSTTFATFLSAWLLHAVALLTSLSSKKPRAGAKGIIGLLVFLFFFGSNFRFFAMRGFTQSLDRGVVVQFYGVEIPWLLFTTIYAMPTLFFIMLAAVRKMRSERAHPFTKPEAIAALMTLSVLLLGGIWGVSEYRGLPLVVTYIMTVAASILLTTVTPNIGEYTKGLRRADREGQSTVTPWSDWSLNRLAVAVCAAVVLTTCTIASQVASDPAPGSSPFNYGYMPEMNYSISITTAIFVVVYVGMAFQAFQLIMPKRGATMFALFLFLAWLVPIVIGSISSAAGLSESVSQVILSLSPVTGLGLAAGASGSEGTRLYQAAVLCPAVAFAFIFNNLVVIYRRKAIAAVHSAKEKHELPAEVVAVG